MTIDKRRVLKFSCRAFVEGYVLLCLLVTFGAMLYVFVVFVVGILISVLLPEAWTNAIMGVLPSDLLSVVGEFLAAGFFPSFVFVALAAAAAGLRHDEKMQEATHEATVREGKMWAEEHRKQASRLKKARFDKAQEAWECFVADRNLLLLDLTPHKDPAAIQPVVEKWERKHLASFLKTLEEYAESALE